jgi:cytidyltransferase-like protein
MNKYTIYWKDKNIKVFVVKLLQELLFEQKENMLAVVYGGRFQPFHKGHYAVYKHLCKMFGTSKVWIATSDKVNMNPDNGDISPLNFEERKEVMIRMFGIDPEHIIKCKNPAFAPVEILEKYKGPTSCVMAVGKKDVDRYAHSSFYEEYPMKGGSPVPFSSIDHESLDDEETAKMYYLPMGDQAGSMSGTKARKLMAKLSLDTPEKERKEVFKEIFGSYDDLTYQLLVSKMSQVKDNE